MIPSITMYDTQADSPTCNCGSVFFWRPKYLIKQLINYIKNIAFSRFSVNKLNSTFPEWSTENIYWVSFEKLQAALATVAFTRIENRYIYVNPMVKAFLEKAVHCCDEHAVRMTHHAVLSKYFDALSPEQSADLWYACARATVADNVPSLQGMDKAKLIAVQRFMQERHGWVLIAEKIYNKFCTESHLNRENFQWVMQSASGNALRGTFFAGLSQQQATSLFQKIGNEKDRKPFQESFRTAALQRMVAREAEDKSGAAELSGFLRFTVANELLTSEQFDVLAPKAGFDWLVERVQKGDRLAINYLNSHAEQYAKEIEQCAEKLQKEFGVLGNSQEIGILYIKEQNWIEHNHLLQVFSIRKAFFALLSIQKCCQIIGVHNVNYFNIYQDCYTRILSDLSKLSDIAKQQIVDTLYKLLCRERSHWFLSLKELVPYFGMTRLMELQGIKPTFDIFSEANIAQCQAKLTEYWNNCTMAEFRRDFKPFIKAFSNRDAEMAGIKMVQESARNKMKEFFLQTPESAFASVDEYDWFAYEVLPHCTAKDILDAEAERKFEVDSALISFNLTPDKQKEYLQGASDIRLKGIVSWIFEGKSIYSVPTKHLAFTLLALSTIIERRKANRFDNGVWDSLKAALGQKVVDDVYSQHNDGQLWKLIQEIIL